VLRGFLAGEGKGLSSGGQRAGQGCRAVHHVTTGLKDEMAHDFYDGGVLATCVSVGSPTGVTVVAVATGRGRSNERVWAVLRMRAERMKVKGM
jgi:hypothetical protein